MQISGMCALREAIKSLSVADGAASPKLSQHLVLGNSADHVRSAGLELNVNAYE